MKIFPVGSDYCSDRIQKEVKKDEHQKHKQPSFKMRSADSSQRRNANGQQIYEKEY